MKFPHPAPEASLPSISQSQNLNFTSSYSDMILCFDGSDQDLTLHTFAIQCILVAFPREKGYGSSVPCLSLQHEGHRARCDQITILHLLMIIYKAVPSSYRHEKETNVESKHKPRVMWICYLVFKHFLRVIHHPLQNNIARTPL